MEKLKFVLNCLFWAFDALSKLCGNAEEMLRTYQNYQKRAAKKAAKRKK